MTSKQRRRRLYETTAESSSSGDETVEVMNVDVEAPLAENNSHMPDALARSSKVIQRWCGYTAAYCVIPIPGIELAAVSTSQVLMIREISREYGVDFSWRRANILVAALFGGITSSASMLLLTRVLLPFASVLSLAGLNASITYILGQAFSVHFNAGGTLDDFDIKSVRKDLVDGIF